MQILVQQIWHEARETAFLTCSQMMLKELILESLISKAVGDTAQVWEFLAAPASQPGDFPTASVFILKVL